MQIHRARRIFKIVFSNLKIGDIPYQRGVENRHGHWKCDFKFSS